ncbi:hypothetical protein K2Z83_12875 [Oscillochloris sp. ZM17-4]|uniref:hypothetical protein n=1 Tax=Oscillochloris sp. ZM17-4 TaxID=2866714 RepID=UPI001C7376B2|nr:hypothetical protein [Oscillochloris sp. ZM17-4]MBX0328571.1 hypothetical protein [Oscillochloris sp. ZM17-4]
MPSPRSAAPLARNRRPQILIAHLDEGLQLADRPEGGQHLRARDLLQNQPVGLDQLADRAHRRGHRECGQGEAEPAVRRAEQDGLHLLVAALLLEVAQVRAAPATGRHRQLALVAKGVGHAPLIAAGVALHDDVGRLARDAQLQQADRAGAGARALVDEVVPGEVVEVALLAGHQEARR